MQESLTSAPCWNVNRACIQGFVIKVPEAKHNTTGWHPEGEALAITHQAGLCFSLALRTFYAFGLAALYIPGPTSLLVATIVMTAILFFTDNMHKYEYEKLLQTVRLTKSGNSSEFLSR